MHAHEHYELPLWAWPTTGYLSYTVDHGPSDGVLDCKGPLSGTIAPNTLAEVNEEVKLAADGQEEARLVSLLHTHGEGASNPVQQC